MLEAGIPVTVVSEILGHSGIQLTLDAYSHVSPELQEEEMNRITKVSSFMLSRFSSAFA